MITLRTEPPILFTPFESVVTIETKAGMLQAADIWGLNIPKSWRKDDIAYALDHCLKNETQYVWDNLGQEAINMIDGIIQAGKGKYITIPYSEKHNRLQKSLLVVSAEDQVKGECRLQLGECPRLCVEWRGTSISWSRLS